MMKRSYLVLALLVLIACTIVLPVSASSLSREFETTDITVYNMTYDYAKPNTAPAEFITFYAILGIVLLFLSIPPMPCQREAIWPICSIPPLFLAAWYNLCYVSVVGAGSSAALKTYTEWGYMEHHLMYLLWPGTIVLAMFIILAIFNTYRILTLPHQVTPGNGYCDDEEKDDH